MTLASTTSPTARPAHRSSLMLVVGTLSVAGAFLVLAGCDTPAHDKDTNATKYNYSYNK